MTGKENAEIGTMPRLKNMQKCRATLAVLLAVSLPVRGAEPPPAPDVVRELQQFESTWPGKIPPDDARFGILRVLSFFNLDFPGMEKVKAGITSLAEIDRITRD